MREKEVKLYRKDLIQIKNKIRINYEYENNGNRFFS
jgi:hypothetical protein